MKTVMTVVVLAGLISTGVFAQNSSLQKVAVMPEKKGLTVPKELTRSFRPPNLPSEIAVFAKCHSDAAAFYSFQLVSKESPKGNFGIVSEGYHYNADSGHDLFVTLNYGTRIMDRPDSTHYSMVIDLDCRAAKTPLDSSDKADSNQ